MAIVKLSGTKIPKVKIKVGHAQPATYKIALKPNGKKRKNISMSNEADLADHPDITKISDLKGAELEWDVRVARATPNPTESYSIRVRIEQDGNLSENGFFKDEKEFGDALAHVYFDLVELR